jgi:hypothetical protein
MLGPPGLRQRRGPRGTRLVKRGHGRAQREAPGERESSSSGWAFPAQGQRGIGSSFSATRALYSCAGSSIHLHWADENILYIYLSTQSVFMQ